ncbi:TetR/AcrR family transcriptional regulator [Neogemmobacter tilapiae]|uniref:TetR family transcriptional regulator n=1 Tax=Neogemmobacter tilapiae TaxID=875041 RepID=A0A918TWU6_9RHOB|nr:TetR family transcriptional regulator [Gemmobacter tilapiae]
MNTRGRPREFDTDETVEALLTQFWQQGYAPTSLTDLCTATGLAKPSLYAAFGNKEGLFLAALDAYQTRHAQPALDAMMAEPDARTAILRLFENLIDRPQTALGCLITHNLTEAQLPPQITQALQTASHHATQTIAQRLQRAKDDHQLPPDTDLHALLSFLLLTFAGLVTMARAGTPPETLRPALHLALTLWPHPPKNPST